MKPTALLTVLLAGIVSLSACVGNDAKAQGSGDGDIPPAAPAQFDDDTGAITGSVTDDQIQPLEGAQVGILEIPDRLTVTDAAGAFTFNNVPPGKYSIVAQRLGFVSGSRSVEVFAGQAVSVQFALAPLAVEAPYHFTHPFTGFIDCVVALVRTTHYGIANCPSQISADDTKNFHEIHTKTAKDSWPVNFQAVMVEAVWNNQAQPDWLAFDFNDRNIGYFGVYYRFRGTTPVQFYLERCGDYRAQNFGRAPMPCADEQIEASRMHVETFYVGKYQDVTHNLDAACRDNVTNPAGGSNLFPGYQAGCYGVGPGIGLRWNNYVTVWYGMKPEDPDKLSFLPDA
ncbi:MAG: carboxypeptidase regulatory-like domain-containing protein [Euryarchaeota archaeon]|nr:carboxypeptidase regulatory-like domain-containing protein [Euryarchaeota archaeon]